MSVATASRGRDWSSRLLAAAAARPFALLAVAALLCLWLAGSPSPTAIDEVVYALMAESMASGHGFWVINGDHLAVGDPFQLTLMPRFEGGYTPQYPGGYAILAAPFYALFGLKGLTLINAVAMGAAMAFTYRIVLRLYGDEIAARGAVLILALATFAPQYAVSVWPHALAMALVTGAAYTAVLAAQIPARRLAWSAASGLVIGFGVTIRADLILLAPAILAWLRFQDGTGRIAAIVLLFGLAPGLLASAWMNEARFGVFAPFSYGRTTGAEDVSRYYPLAASAALALAALLVLDPLSPRLRHLARRMLWPLAGAVLIGLALAAEPAWRIVKSIYVLVVDLQAYDFWNRERGVERLDSGWLSFFGQDKKALAQSLPFLGLLALSLIEFLRGRRASAHALSFVLVGAFVVFYGHRQWHGGMGANMRYFVTALPFIAILASAALAMLVRAAGVDRRSLIRAGAAGLALFALGLAGAAAWPENAPGFKLYPQLALFAGIAATAATFALIGGNGAARTGSLLGAAGLAFAAAAAWGSDFAGDQRARYAVSHQAPAFEAFWPDGSLVITGAPEFALGVRQTGGAVAHSWKAEPEELATAADAFLAAGRCVYVLGEPAIEAVRGVLELQPTLGAPMATAAGASQSERCARGRLAEEIGG